MRSCLGCGKQGLPQRLCDDCGRAALRGIEANAAVRKQSVQMQLSGIRLIRVLSGVATLYVGFKIVPLLPRLLPCLGRLPLSAEVIALTWATGIVAGLAVGLSAGYSTSRLMVRGFIDLPEQLQWPLRRRLVVALRRSIRDRAMWVMLLVPAVLGLVALWAIALPKHSPWFPAAVVGVYVSVTALLCATVGYMASWWLYWDWAEVCTRLHRRRTT